MKAIYGASDFFDITNKVFRVAGWHYNLKLMNRKSNCFHETYYWCLNMLFLVITLQSLIYLYNNFGEPGKFLEITEMILVVGFITMLIIKSYFVVYRNRATLTKMIDDLDDIMPKLLHVQKTFNIESYYRNNRVVSIAFSITYSTLLIIFIIMPILKKVTGFIFGIHVKRELPFKFYYPFDATQDYVYPLMYIYETWLCEKCAIEVLGADLLFCNITSLITMRLKMLRQEIAQIDVKNNERSLEILHECVKVHLKLMTINNRLEDIYSFSLLGDLMASTVITCLAAFNAFLGVSGISLLKFIICFFTCLFRVGLQCAHSDNMTRSSLNVANGAYENLWYKGSTKYKNVLLIIIMRSQKPFVMTFYKFQTLSLESFTFFVRASYSLFALLQTMYHSDT